MADSTPGSSTLHPPSFDHDDDDALIVSISEEPLDCGAAIARVTHGAAGGIGVFVGTTRNSFMGRTVTRLEYECYRPMAERVLARIARAARARFGLQRALIWHRVGSVPVTEASVVVAASAEHRAEALAATTAMIHAVKSHAPIWKLEWYEGDDRAWKQNCECARDTPSSAVAEDEDDQDDDPWGRAHATGLLDTLSPSESADVWLGRSRSGGLPSTSSDHRSYHHQHHH